MNYKEFIRKHKKIITLVAIGLLGILLIVGVFFGVKSFIKDNKDESSSTSVISNTTPEKEQTALKILNEKVADSGLLIFLSFFPNDKNTNALTKNINFRKSIYHSLNRKNLEQTNDNFKLSSSPVLFTKAFFNDNHVYFPAKNFPFNEEDAKAYKDDKLENDGFDEDKALNLLQQAWDDLTTEQKQENYKLNLLVQEEDLEEYLEETKLKDLTDSILKQIKHLFTTFINKNNLPENQIKMQIVDKINNTQDPSQNMNMRLDIIPEKAERNEENCNEANDYGEAKYYWYIINDVLNSGIREEKITLNFSPLKIYLDEEKQQGNEMDTRFFSGLKSETGSQYDKVYPGVDPQTGLFTSSHEEFLDFYDDVILKLLPRGSNKTQEKQLIQQTYEEIFIKLLALIKDYRFHIPLVNYIAKN
ncbi:MAG: hypothetical protein NOI47_000185 [Candidatus Phytoplasma pruni]|nr:hypothetical protein [Candidatus Phytoplasma pruni]